ncbi:helix-turn-helix domain-containing protein [Paenarthrobacter sp. TYUT067]|uniref:helix-turn-helix transcriptional regulator n=1 Tax=Paenarthrobacter sp. TYUT067 TaxID=2926245 RepID=UPI002030BD27|nr:helix-turn-helix domain-containing protein [Paenarthrobacter sp. TYUT067]MCM0614476.1 helix-turn-helix domain-containing protein [Paenarthrobacter sp. TYUT067]
MNSHYSTEPHYASDPVLPSSPYMTRKQVAAYLNVSEKWLAQSGRATGPRFHKFGSQCRYLRDDVLNWARQQRATR